MMSGLGGVKQQAFSIAIIHLLSPGRWLCVHGSAVSPAPIYTPEVLFLICLAVSAFTYTTLSSVAERCLCASPHPLCHLCEWIVF